MVNDNKKRQRLSNKHKKNKRKFGGIFTIPLILFLIVASIIIISYNIFRHTYFKISEVYIKGNMITTDEEILKIISNPVGKSIFTYDTKKSEKILLEQENINKAKVYRKFPDDIVIEIEETYPFLEAKYKDKKYLISNTGEILSNKKTSLKVAKYIGEIDTNIPKQLFTKDKEKLKFIQEIISHSFSEELDQLNLENKDEIGIIIKGIQVKFGSLNKSDYKLKLLDSVLKDIDQKGKKAKKIDLTKGENPIVEVKDESLNE